MLSTALFCTISDPEEAKLRSAQRKEIALSGGRKKILALKEKRRQEDIAAALAMKASTSKPM